MLDEASMCLPAATLSRSASSEDASTPDFGQRPPPPVRQALIAAAARITTPDSFANPRQLIRVDGAPVIIHLLRGLQSSGIVRTVITLGHAAHLLVEEVRKHSFGKMTVEFVWCEASSWKRGHASNILAARSMFPRLDEPFLLVMSDHIFDHRLLRRLTKTRLASGDVLVLIDDSRAMVEWASPGGAHCLAHCKNGHCGSLVKVTKGEGDRVSRIGKKLAGFDALEAGAYVVRPKQLFDVLHRLLAESIYCTLAEGMNVFASEGCLSYLAAEELEWFGESTVASLPTPIHSTAVLPHWRQRALSMLRMTSPHLMAVPTPGPADEPDELFGGEVGGPGSLLDGGGFGGYVAGGECSGGELTAQPLYELGSTIGLGGTSVVVHGRAGRSRISQGLKNGMSPATSRRMQSGLAVKVIRKGATEALGDVERSVMWEVHVLQQLNHQHIVRVMDVIEVVDATYIIMERVDGPELTEFMQSFPDGRLPSDKARCMLCHVLCALRHAHRHGFLHCDVKPDNVRLNKACDHAVLTDWGYARLPGMRPEAYMCGTPAYASPEQLTGYSPDSVTGRRQLCAATDVWSLGVSFFEMVCGHLPFVAEEHHTLVRLVLATRYKVADCVHRDDARLIQSMLLLAPTDRATLDELAALPLLVATGALSTEPEEATLVRGADGRVVAPAAPCGECDESTEGPIGSWLRRHAWLRKGLWTVLYGSLCAAAVWSHLSAPSNDEVLYEMEGHHQLR